MRAGAKKHEIAMNRKHRQIRRVSQSRVILGLWTVCAMPGEPPR